MNTALLLAAGSSTRAGQNKLWANVHGQPLWMLAYKTFAEHPSIDWIVLVVPKGEEFRFLPFLDANKAEVVSGGATRMESFKRGLAAAGELTADDLILDHNAASPNVTAEEISAVIEVAKEHGAAAVAQPVVDTVAEVASPENPKNSNCDIVSFRERTNLRLMQTPQAVRGDILKKLLDNDELIDTTDLSSALIQHTKVKILPASPLNKKITFAEDLAALTAQSFLGEDSHRFLTGAAATKTQLTLGGLTIPDCPGMEANSDGDVILHAIGRALAQATGQNFSELADPLSLSGDQDSRDYLAPLLEKIKVRHLSLSIEGARPRIDPLAPALTASLAEILKIPSTAIRLSAHTGEDLTPFGKGEGIRCLALVQLSKA